MSMTLTYLLLLISHITLSDVLIKDVNAVIHLESDHKMVLYGGDENQASIYDAANDEMLQHIVKTGRGPGESQSLSAFYLDDETGIYYFGDEAGQLFLFNSDFELIEQTRVGNYVMTDMYADADHIWISIRAVIAE